LTRSLQPLLVHMDHIAPIARNCHISLYDSKRSAAITITTFFSASEVTI